MKNTGWGSWTSVIRPIRRDAAAITSTSCAWLDKQHLSIGAPDPRLLSCQVAGAQSARKTLGQHDHVECCPTAADLDVRAGQCLTAEGCKPPSRPAPDRQIVFAKGRLGHVGSS